MRANGMRVSKAFGSVGIHGRNAVNRVVPLGGSIPMAPIGNTPPKYLSKLHEVPK
jgi:hypothetical protein